MIIIPPTITTRTRPEISSFVIETIESEGIVVPPTSRLRQMHDLWHSGQTSLGPEHPSHEIALEGDRDMQLLAFAFDQLSNKPSSHEYRRLLQKLVSDSVLPQHDRGNSQGRDAAFEVFVGAVCTGAQLQPVNWAEPDVTFTLDDMTYGMAAKRIKNLNNLVKRVKKAVDQIVNTGLPGMVVLDLGLAFNPENKRLRLMSDSIFYAEYEKNLWATWNRYHLPIQKHLARGDVLGIVIHDYHVRPKKEGWQLTGITLRVPSDHATSDQRNLYEKLSTLYVYGLPNQSDATCRPLVIP